MRTLHVAALPFPSPQGTQGLLHQMLCALGERGHDTHLLCYPHGASAARTGAPRATPAYTVHRVPTRSFSRSLRSGPSLDKLWLDAGLARELVRVSAALAPDLIVAHHVEAAACALARRHRPLLFVAHTSLVEELPTYAPAPLAPIVSRLGGLLETALVRRSDRTLAVSPTLARMLSAQTGCEVAALPLPWPLAAPITHEEALAARAALGLSPVCEVALYAGNLDAYQGLAALLPALALLARQRPALRWLVATESDPSKLALALCEHGLVDRTTFAPLADEAARRLVHAAADCALVPRQSAGGVPVKLLDALARGVPTVASATALAGYPLADHCTCVADQTPQHWSQAIASVLEDRPKAHARATSARTYVAQEHSAERFAQALEHSAKRFAKALEHPIRASERSQRR